MEKEIETPQQYIKRMKKVKFNFFIRSILGLRKMEYLRRHHIFGHLGQDVLFQPRILPRNPKLIKIHNNVMIAAGVTFFEYDVINAVFSNLDKSTKEKWRIHQTCIEIFDNVFIGGNATLIGNIKIGPNAIVAAGSVVNKDVKEGTIVAGNPAVVVGYFNKLFDKRKSIDFNVTKQTTHDWNNELWATYYTLIAPKGGEMKLI